MVVRACNEETRHSTTTLHLTHYPANLSRTLRVYYYYSCFIFSELIAPLVASLTARVSLWLPFGISYLLLILTFPLLAIMPNEENKSKRNDFRASGMADDLEESPTYIKALKMLFHAAID